MYAPTTVANDETIDAFYDSLTEAKHKCKHYYCTIIVGDMNAEGGANAYLDVSGSLGIELSERGEKKYNCASKTNFPSRTLNAKSLRRSLKDG